MDSAHLNQTKDIPLDPVKTLGIHAWVAKHCLET